MFRVFSLLALIFGGTLAAGAAPTAAEESTSGCLECHGAADAVSEKKDPATGQPLSVAVLEKAFRHSVHGALGCASCHPDIGSAHPDDGSAAKPVDCASCHAQRPDHARAVQDYLSGIHGVIRQMGGRAAARCVDCHGKHDMRAVKDPESPVFKLNLPATCSNCHRNDKMARENHMKLPDAAAQYIDSMHGRALTRLGLIVAPSCNDCHGVHAIKPASVESSPIHRRNVAATCGRCHVKVEQAYAHSVHGRLLAEGKDKAPVCTDCHTAHQIEDTRGAHFKATSDQKCGQCHEDRLERYHETYHGKAMALGRSSKAPDVAACYDCHGHHDILPSSDPASRLSREHRVETCAQCHPGATTSFVGYVPHANHFDRENYPQFYWAFIAMTALLLGVFTFFGAHTALWLVRSAWLYWRDSRAFRESKIESQKGGEWFTRFTPFDRFQHALVVTSFLLLVLTGMPLKFYDTAWARGIFSFLGGTDVARSLHRFGAVITFLYFGLHLVSLAVKSWRGRAAVLDPTTGRPSWARLRGVLFGPDSMLPNRGDWDDFIAHQKWFFGKGPRPQFDRWTYWEKFDYLAVFWGIFAIGLSGLVMWFPIFFTQFLPGWAINIALIVHSDEALLAAGFIFTVHFFNTHFRLEKFPMDTVMFSGRISRTEMLHERRRWFDRLQASGRLDAQRVRDEWERWKAIARSFGYLFFGCGVVLLVLIVYAMFARLLH